MDATAELDSYLSGEVTLEELRTRLILLALEGDEVPTLAHAIEYTIDEAASEGSSIDELDAELRKLAAEHAHVAV